MPRGSRSKSTGRRRPGRRTEPQPPDARAGGPEAGNGRTTMSAHQQLMAVTDRIRERSKVSRQAYLERIASAAGGTVKRSTLSCGNLAHGFAACAAQEKTALAGNEIPNLGIITAYNDMLSAHQPYETYPALIREAALEAGGVAQVAGGVPAMCDGVTQGRPGMELSLFS